MTYEFGTWYPIESAPKDGRRVLLGNSEGKSLEDCYWAGGVFGHWQLSGQSYSTYSATHWMPLPPPPAKEG